jgi:hypothetical protein
MSWRLGPVANSMIIIILAFSINLFLAQLV